VKIFQKEEVMKSKVVLIAVAAVLMNAGAVRSELEVKDHPMVSRFPGSEVLEHKVAEFDEYQLALGQIVDTDKFTKAQRLEGKVTRFKYSVPVNRSSLEIQRSYESALQRSGFQVLFRCSGKECFSDKFNYGYTNGSWGTWCTNCEEPMRYVAARLIREGREVYVSLVVVKDHYEGGTWLSVVEAKPMEEGLVRVNAAAMANEITQNGHATVYGIYFDTGKAIVKPESEATLAEIAKLLSGNRQLKLHLVGHTDNVGTVPSNLVLSKQRADAVLMALVSRHQIGPERLQSAGVGSMAPIATNRSEEGRAKNRRVELVEQ
jgi:OOP family OmpA-OmpF porin